MNEAYTLKLQNFENKHLDNDFWCHETGSKAKKNWIHSRNTKLNLKETESRNWKYDEAFNLGKLTQPIVK